MRGLLRAAVVLVVAVIGVGGLAAAPAFAAAPLDQASLCPDATVAAFGPNVCVFNDTMDQSAIQSDLDAISTQQVPLSSEFDSGRYAVLFEPGSYGTAANPLVFQVGYYTEVAGLGALPQDTVINGAIEVYNNDCAAGTSNCNSYQNVWRSLSDLTLNVDLPSSPPAYAPPVQDAYGSGCANSEESWSASQGAPIRRVIINGSPVFQDYCASDNYVAGGFIADSEISGDLDFYGDQEFLVRNSDIGGANGCPDGLWNMVYSGVEGAPSTVFSGQCEQNTVLSSSPVTEEEPFLQADSQDNFSVFVPAVQQDSVGPSWAGGTEAGTSVPISQFFVADPGTSLHAINAALSAGQNLILTPGVYDLTGSIKVDHPDTVVLGLGLATLVPQNGTAAIDVASNEGVKVSGLIIDAGPVTSPSLLLVGRLKTPASAADPDLIQDVFFRIGGAETTSVSATVSLRDSASYSIIDDVWAWRADLGNDVGWTENTANKGVVIAGSDVTAYGLSVDHYQKLETVWRGQGGTDVFFENELPTDPPSQAAWMFNGTHDGYPAFLVRPDVTSFAGYGMGSYVSFTGTAATLFNVDAFQAPTTAGVQFHDVFDLWITGSGGYDSVIDGSGGPATSTDPGFTAPVDVTSYP